MPDPATLSELGLAGLFVAAFLAGSILPFASEAVLLGVLALGVAAAPAVLAATAGNVLGALSVYGMGRLLSARSARVSGGVRGGIDAALARLTAEDPARLERAQSRLRRYGAAALLAAWVPIVGDALVLAAGLLALPLPAVTLFVTAGKAARYVAVALAVS